MHFSPTVQRNVRCPDVRPNFFAIPSLVILAIFKMNALTHNFAFDILKVVKSSLLNSTNSGKLPSNDPNRFFVTKKPKAKER